MQRIWQVAALGLVFTYLFFAEYLAPIRSVHLTYDLLEFHYPLIDYGFQALKHGRFPEWDAAIYSGIGYASNTQAALFYPPTWLLFAASRWSEHVSFQGVQIFIMLHIWLGFVLAYVWLVRGRRLGEFAALLGAVVFAFSGYPCLELTHQGTLTQYAWYPLGLLGIDEAVDGRRWQPLWKLVAASALCFLAGYPPTWLVFAIVAIAYALGRGWRSALGASAALISSLFVAMVQLWPSSVIAATKYPENRYGTGYQDPIFYISYLIPNFFNFGMDVPADANPFREYLYLGVAAIFGIACLLVWRKRGLQPLLIALAAALMFLTNPFNLVASVIARWPAIGQVCRDWTFLAGVSLVLAALAACGLDAFLARPSRGRPFSWMFVCVAAAIGWAAWELMLWKQARLASGWRGAVEPAVTLAIFCGLVFLWRSTQGRGRTAVGAALLILIGADYKVFGTGKRFNTSAGIYKLTYSVSEFPAMNEQVYARIRQHPEDRVVMDQRLNPLDLRHAGLTTPQGFDPLLPEAYKELITSHGGKFRSDREFDVEPDNLKLLDVLGVRYYIAADPDRLKQLSASPKFRELEPADSYYHVFEYIDAQPGYRWEAGSSVQVLGWTPEHRAFGVNSPTGGRFVLLENLLPGWVAAIDGKAAAPARWEGAFQAVAVPEGAHRVEFRYGTPGLRFGLLISVGSVILCLILCLVSARRYRAERPPPESVPGQTALPG